MKTSFRLLAGTIFLTASYTALSSDTLSKEIKAIESGLRGSVQFDGDPGWTLEERMKHYGVPGLSVAVIKDYKIHWSKTYGVSDRETNNAVTQETLFQAGSISKPVAAYGALKMVEENKLSLDRPVNEQLNGWKIPENEFTKKQPVALKHLLNHSAGLTVHGFWGYSDGLTVPTITQVLQGEKPANSAPVIIDLEPETRFRYSGGGYTVAQKLMSDVSKKSFPALMDSLVLSPLKMQRSTYQQPLPTEKLKFAAAGYLPNKSAVPGKRHVYPEMAAAGLWTTAEDLAKFVIDVQLTLKKDQGQVVNQRTVDKMLTPFVSPNTGLGFFLDVRGDEIYFGHGGWDEGFSADLIGHKIRGYGVVIMINSNHPKFINELKNSIADYYQWDDYLAKNLIALPINKVEQQKISGRYLFNPDMLFTISNRNDRVYMQYLDGLEMEVFRIGENQYIRREHDAKFSFEKDPKNGLVNLIFQMGNGETHTRNRMTKNDVVPFELVTRGSLKKAEKIYLSFFEKNPQQKEQSEANILQLAEKKFLAGNKAEALSILKMSVRLFKNSPYSWEKLAHYYQYTNDLKQAANILKQAIKIIPNEERLIKALEGIERGS